MIYLIIIAVLALAILSCTAHNRDTNQESQPLLTLTQELSGGSEQALGELQLFLSNRQEYFNRFEDELYQRGIESSEEVSPEVALVDALVRTKMLVYQDHSSDPADTLVWLNELSEGSLGQSVCYKELEKHYSETEYGLSAFLEAPGYGPSLFDCISGIGYKLLAINEDSDAYALILVAEEKVPNVTKLARDADIPLYFANK
ncbi:MAG: hypothetical protein CME36_10985 [unclassified Hahellaceae]|nr:hypothetical protein [Hahellaceae bacterium]|tara:strand:+ start:269 stop:874 length:606 start_codon:yes stop_codon:yes gene_type:complete